MRKKVSIITVVYNQVAVTLDFLESIRQQEYRLIEIIVVDNGSKEDTRILKTKFPEIKLIRSDENLGFAGGNNLGIAKAKGDYLFFVNNDTIVPMGTITGLVKRFAALPDAGILCPQICYFDEPDMVQYAGSTEMNPWTGRNRSLGYRQKLVVKDQVQATAYPNGAAMFTSRKLVNEIGLLPEDFFLYYEELDWAFQFKRAGLKIYVDHRLHILHKVSVSSGQSSPLKLYYLTRNRILFMRRNFKGLRRMMFLVFFATVSVPKAILSMALSKNFEHLKAYYKAITWHFKASLKYD